MIDLMDKIFISNIKKGFIISLTLALCLSVINSLNISSLAQTSAPWHEVSRKYRIKLSLTSPIQVVSGTPVEALINFTQLLQSAAQSGTVNLNSLKLVEVNNQGGIVDASVPFQFDVSSGTTGKIIFILSDISANNSKNYYLYFDAGANFSLPSFTNQVSVTDNINYQGQSSYRFTTTNGIYYYHKQGAGLASMIDNDNKDWLSYKPIGNYAGNFRGIPNMVHPEGFFHPGDTGSTSQIISQGPLKTTIHSQTTNGTWSSDWEIYPKFVRMTLKASGHPYWFLYEGTPNGAFNTSTNFMILSNGEKFTGNQEWKKDIPNPEWIYFSDTAINRSLFVSHLEDDNQNDSYVVGGNAMTVFGFGREGLAKYLSATPSHFVIGFTETNTYNDVKRIINSYSQNISLNKSAIEVRSGVTSTITSQATPSITFNITPTSPVGQTRLNLNIFLHGIGNGGDNVSSESKGNMNPLRTTRTAIIEAYDSNNQLSVSENVNLIFNTTNGYFTGNINTNSLSSGAYIIRVKIQQYLNKPIPGIINITAGQIISLPSVKLITGDTDNDNLLSVLDYNLILDCFSELTPPRNCNDPAKKLMNDLTDDGNVNQFDYNLFLREISTQLGQ